jgi:hypothetical protein
MYCATCFRRVSDLAYATTEKLDFEVAKYKRNKQMLKLLDKTTWDQIKSPASDYCLDCGDKRLIAKQDFSYNLDGL